MPSTHQRGGLYVWEFEKGPRKLNVRVEGRLILNNTPLILQAALAGFGLVYLPEDTLPCRDATSSGF